MEFSNYYSDIFKNTKQDIPASLVVFFVALPLCLGIALASGAPLFSGIISGIIGGVIVGLISGSKLGVSGPAAGLTAVVLTSINALGYNEFLLAVVLAGLLQIVLGILKAGIIGYYFPTAVIKGMLTGIGIIIILKQIPHFFGYQSIFALDWDYVKIDIGLLFDEIASKTSKISLGSTIIASISLLLMLVWDNVLSKKYNFFKLIPGPFVAVALGVTYVILFSGDESLGIIRGNLASIPIVNSFADFKSIIEYPVFSAIYSKQVWIIALTIATIGSIETLLSVEATDKLDPEKRKTPRNRELVAQGIGNTLSGLIGGLPITQVVVRSSANIQSGGKTQLSAILHGFILLFTVVLIPEILNKIPLSVLAAILLIVGYKLAKPRLFIDMFKLGRAQFIPFIVTVVVIVYVDLLWGVALGLLMAIVNIIYKNYQHSHILSKHSDADDNQIVRMTLSEELSFLNKGSVVKALESIPKDSKLVLDISRNVYTDYDIIEMLQDYSIRAKSRNIEIEVKTKDVILSNPKDYYRLLKYFRTINIPEPK